MMRHLLLFSLLLLPSLLPAQTPYACFSWQAVLGSMPDYAEAQRNLSALRSQYADEMARAEQEFNTKYEAFLEGQRSFAPSIMKKRQAELRELMEKNITFRQESERLLRQAEMEMMAPLTKRLRQLLQQVGEENGYAFILNTDNEACPWINPASVTDITLLLKERARTR